MRRWPAYPFARIRAKAKGAQARLHARRAAPARWLGMALGLAALAGPARAIDLLPFDYVPAPAGTTALLGYYLYGDRGRFDSSGFGKVPNSGVETHIAAARLTHWNEIAGVPVAAQLILPWGDFRNGRIGGAALNEPTGFFDPTLTLAFWPLSQPEERRWIAVANYLSFPLGEYHPGDPLNTGENRWKNDLQVGFIQGLPGGFTLDLAADLIVYGDNDRAGTGRQTLTQKPSFEAYAWLAYNLDPGTWGAIGWAGAFGGRQELAGAPNGLKTEFQQVRAAFGAFVRPDLQVVASFGHDYHVEGGFGQDVAIQLRILKIF